MRIVIDLQGAQSDSSRNRGIGRYSLSLAKAMTANRGKHEIIIALNAHFSEAVDAIYDEFSALLPSDNIVIWQAPGPVRYSDRESASRREVAKKIREAFLASLRPDMVLVMSLFEGFSDDTVTSISALSHTPTAVILYDLIPLIHAAHYLENSDLKAWYLDKIEALKQADLLLSISQSAKNEALEYLQFNPEKVVNISTAADAHFCPRTIESEREAEIRKKYHLSRSFVMYTGGIDHRKNIDGLIRAYAMLPASLRNDHQLVIVCSISEEDKQRLSKLVISENMQSDEVIFTGFVTDDDLVSLYNLCDLFIFPSWHEGFGLPALEAMLCECVVIGANTSSLPEVIGLEEALFDPRSDPSIAAKLEQALTDGPFRDRLTAHNLQQVKKFSWDTSAQAALKAIEKKAGFAAAKQSIKTPALSKLHLAYISPLPARQNQDGKSNYDAELLSALSQHYRINIITEQPAAAESHIQQSYTIRTIEWFRNHSGDYDRILYHFDNGRFHRDTLALAEEIPGIVILHNFFLYDIVGQMESKGQRSFFWTDNLYRSHGYTALKELFLTDSADDLLQKYPANLSLLQNAIGIIVDSEEKVQLIKKWYGKIAASWSIINTNLNPIAEQYTKSIEDFYADGADKLPGLMHSIPQDIKRWNNSELQTLSEAIAQDFPPEPRMGQILLDVSPLTQDTAPDKLGQNILGLVQRLLETPPSGYRVEPVYWVKSASTYCYARQFTMDLLSIQSELADDEKIDSYRGDIFLGSDIRRDSSADGLSTFRQMRHKGVIVSFVLYDSTLFSGSNEKRESYLARLKMIASLDLLYTLSRAEAEEVKKRLAEEKINTQCLFDIAEGEGDKVSGVLIALFQSVSFFDLKKKIVWRVEGPFDSSYSLALINRETALALDTLGHDVILHSTEGPGDFDPREDFLADHPEIAKLYQKSTRHNQREADVCSRNLYPPRVSDMKSRINLLHHYAWEESAFPQEWVNNFNLYLQGMTCLSSHVQKVMIDNGVRVPLAVSGCGVDHWERIVADEKYRLNDTHQFRFLHVSSCFPRKGADLLLKAYGKAFDNSDDVILIIKTFPNPHNEIHTWLKEAREINGKFPDVMIIEEDLPTSQLKALYRQCHALVGPSRAEGFGLPFAEAMLSGLPVITTGWGGQLDFCSDETAWLIDYAFTEAKTHFELSDSVWAEPSVKHLAKIMREIYALPLDERIQKPKQGRDLLLEKFRWKDATKRLVDSARVFAKNDHMIKPKIGWITTWNTKCGIAAYSKHLIDRMDHNITILAAHTETIIASDTPNVHRCWRAEDDEQLIELSETIERLGLDTIVLQFNYGFFNFYHLYEFLSSQHQRGRTVVIMMHATTDPEHILFKHLETLLPVFDYLTRILVHSVTDLNHLKTYGLVDNVALFPHGIPDWESTPAEQSSTFILASYGFFLPHKGLLELIDTIQILAQRGIDIRLKMVNAEYPVPISQALVREASAKIEAYGLTQQIELISDFLPDEESLVHLGSADLLLFPYQETGESSSAAVRYGLAAGTPVAVTPLNIFEDVDQAVYKLSGFTPQKMAESIAEIVTEIQSDSEMAQKRRSTAQKWCETHRYSKLGIRLGNMLHALANQK